MENVIIDQSLKNSLDGVLICYVDKERSANQTFVFLMLFQTW
jgi:hypothetical protein